MRKILGYVSLVLFVTLASSVHSQTSVAGSGQLASTPASLNTRGPNQSVISALSTLPEAETLVYINSQRVLNELLPKVMPPKDFEGMKTGFEEVKKNFNVDPTKVEYIVVAVRFKKPTADLRFQAPEALIVAGGDINAESLMGLARMISQGQLRDEKYGALTMGLMTIDPIAKEAEKNPFLRNFSEVGIVALNGNTIAVGSPGYLRAAIDAGEGKERISAETLNSLVRDPNALVSIAGRPWHSFAKSFGMLGTETTPRESRMNSKFGDFYAALTMDATNFMIRGAMNEDNPDTAKIMSNLFSSLLGYAGSTMKEPEIQSLLKNLVIGAEGDEVTIRADVPQQVVMEMMKQQMMKAKKDEPSTSKPDSKPARSKRRVRRRA